MANVETDYGAVAGGTTNCATAFTNALAGASSVEVPHGKTFLVNTNTPITIPSGKRLIGGGTIKCKGTNATFSMASDSTVDGVRFTADALWDQSSLLISSTSSGAKVSNCEFVFLDTEATGIASDNGASEALIINNRQTLGQSLLFATGLVRSTIEGNRAKNAARGFLFYGGSENQIVGNYAKGGIVGILFLSYRTLGANNVMRRNTVANNVVIGPSEEGISFDCRGDEPTLWPEHGTIPLVTVTSTVPGSVTDRVNFSESGSSTNWANGYYAVVLTGAMTGYMAKIVSSGTGFINIERTANSISGLTSGARILITTGVLSNTITGNVVSGAGTFGINLYGSAWHNVIANNQVSEAIVGGGISALSVVDNVIPGVQSWSGCNSIIGNCIGTITTSAGTGEVGIVVDNHAFGGAPFPLASNHNPATLVIGNRVNGNGIRIANTTACVARDNFISGGSLSQSGNTSFSHSENYVGNAVGTF